jgi:UDPglucose 6-dehydrogenase
MVISRRESNLNPTIRKEIDCPKISIIGSGTVGSRIGAGFEHLGYRVIFFDINTKIVNHLKKKYSATTDLKYALDETDISFICVPTPYDDGFDSRSIISAIENIGKVLRDKKTYHLIVIKSTIPPGSAEKIVIPILSKYKKLGTNVGVCMNPEFLTEFAETWTEDQNYTRTFFTEERIVIGEYDLKSGNILEEIYRPLNKPIFRVDLTTAEMIKYASNCMLATKISYWNEIFLICQKIGIDSHKIADIAALDSRIGKYGTIHGKAFGGKCLPKDLKTFIEFAEKLENVPLLKAVDQINELMRKYAGVRE